MASFAVTLSARPRSLESILVIVDERRAADEIALERRLKGHEVEVEVLRGKPNPAIDHADEAGPGKSGRTVSQR